MTYLVIMLLAFVQNISFTMVSRARNRDNMTYYTLCSVLSNGIWFLTMHHLVVTDMSLLLVIPYIVGTVIGSLFGAKLSIYIEGLIGAKT